MRGTSVFVCLLVSAGLEGSALAGQVPVERPRKMAQAVRVPPGSVRLDGRLDDAVWKNAPRARGFSPGRTDRERRHDRPDRCPVRLRRHGPLGRSAHGEQEERGPGAHEPPRRGRPGRVVADRTGHVSRSAHGVHVWRHGIRGAPGPLPPNRQRKRYRLAVRSRLAGEDDGRRGRLDGGALDSIFAAAFQQPAGACLGTERQDLAAAAERAGLLGRDRPDGNRLGLPLRRPAWDRGRRASQAI